MLNCENLTTEVVVMDVFGVDAEGIEHTIDGCTHRAGTAHVVLDVLWGFVIVEVSIEDDLVHEAGGVLHAGSVGGRVGPVQRQVEMEVGEVFLELEEVVEVEYFVEGASAVEVVHNAVGGVECAGEVHDLGTEWCHTCTTANPHHLLAGVVNRMEVAIRSTHEDLIAGLEGEDV